jgi:hypothetical protein
MGTVNELRSLVKKSQRPSGEKLGLDSEALELIGGGSRCGGLHPFPVRKLT